MGARNRLEEPAFLLHGAQTPAVFRESPKP